VPYPRAADLAIKPRFAVRIIDAGDRWTLEDDHGDRHDVTRHGPHWRTPAPAPADPFWLVVLPIPALAIGDRVLMRWSTRSAPSRTPQPDDLIGEIIAETPEDLEVRDQSGVVRTHYRSNGHQVDAAGDRDRLRPVIVGTLEVAYAPREEHR
jgi:hypothetical protein